MTFSNTRSEKCDFRIAYIFNGCKPLKKTVYPCTGKQAAEKQGFSTARQLRWYRKCAYLIVGDIGIG